MTDDWDCPACGVSVRVGSEDCVACKYRNARRNAISAAVCAHVGWLPVTVRYAAAEAALKVAEEFVYRSGARPSSFYTPDAETKHVESHRAHVAAGFCGAVNDSKAWCNGTSGHSGRHHSPVMGSGGLTGEAVYWATNAGCPCPDS